VGTGILFIYLFFVSGYVTTLGFSVHVSTLIRYNTELLKLLHTDCYIFIAVSHRWKCNPSNPTKNCQL